MNSLANLHYAYYRDYYTGIDLSKPKDPRNTQRLQQKNAALVSAKPDLHPQVDPLEALPGYQALELETVYPGTLIGSGYPHSTGTEEEFQLGCSLDYVTGLPYLPGSSVKGILRSAFDEPQLILELTGRENLNVRELERAIFGERPTEDYADTERDVFFDAFPVATAGPLLASDYITPHSSQVAAPIPLQFLKVAPGVRFRFRFCLRPSGGLTAGEKLHLFEAILMLLGIGSKTNVGYGRLSRPTAPAEAPVRADGTPVCQVCGKSVGRRPDGTPYPRCYACSQRR